MINFDSSYKYYLSFSIKFSFLFLEVMISLANLILDRMFRHAVNHHTADLKLETIFHRSTSVLY